MSGAPADATWREWQLTTGFWDLLTRDEQRALLALGQDKNYPPGATMCLEGDPTTHVFVLLGGWVKVLSVN